MSLRHVLNANVVKEMEDPQIFMVIHPAFSRKPDIPVGTMVMADEALRQSCQGQLELYTAVLDGDEVKTISWKYLMRVQIDAIF